MNVQHILDLIEQTSLSHFIINNYWVWPTMETMHFVGLSALFGGLALADLRLIGYMKNIPYKALSKIIPLAVTGFIVNTITGVLFFIGNPHRYYPNIGFRFKMLCILLAGLNLLLYQIAVKPKADTWGPGDKTTLLAKFVGVASILLWIGVITGGRLIPFVE
jgi:uncharacterized membrane protein